MNDGATKRIELAVREVVSLLVLGRYKELAVLTCETRLTHETIQEAVESYGRTLIDPPESSFKDIDVVKVKDAFPGQYSVRFDLYSVEEGRSDLSLECTLIDDHSETSSMRVEIDNIHVL